MLETEQADFADIVTRPDSHRELTELASRHCRAVICQKPMAPAYDRLRSDGAATAPRAACAC